MFVENRLYDRYQILFLNLRSTLNLELYMKQKSLFVKLSGSLIPLAISLVIISIFIYKNSTQKDQIVEKALLAQKKYASMELEMTKMSDALRGFLINPEAKAELDAKKLADDQFAKYSGELAELLKDQKEIKEGIEKIAEYDAKTLNDIEEKAIKLITAKDAGAITFFEKEYKPARLVQIKNFDSLHEKINTYQESALIQIQEQKKNIALQLVILLWVAVVASFGMSYYTAIRSFRSIKRVSDKMVGDSVELTAAVTNMLKLSAELAELSSQQTFAVQQTASTINDISGMVKKTAHGANESENVATNSKNTAELGKNIMQNLIDAMNEINTSNNNMAQAIIEGNKKLENIVAVINNIESKTKVINDIVFQTKLLSFNASVEAARAGEHGKGFAVVAEEVGSLAQMSGTAAKEISNMLDESTNMVRNIVREQKNTVEGMIALTHGKVEQGLEIANQCDAVLVDIFKNSETLLSMSQGISQANQEQSIGIESISAVVQMIDQTVTQSNNTATGFKDMADQLAQQAKGLRTVASDLKTTLFGSKIERIKWQTRFAVGVMKMDDEHKVLFEKMNSVIDQINKDEYRQRNEFKLAFEDLARYAQKHFSDEEMYLESISYPQLKEHKELHASLIALLEGHLRDVKEGKADGALLIHFLNDWLIGHILGVDMKYGKIGSRLEELKQIAMKKAS